MRTRRAPNPSAAAKSGSTSASSESLGHGRQHFVADVTAKEPDELVFLHLPHLHERKIVCHCKFQAAACCAVANTTKCGLNPSNHLQTFFQNFIVVHSQGSSKFCIFPGWQLMNRSKEQLN